MIFIKDRDEIARTKEKREQEKESIEAARGNPTRAPRARTPALRVHTSTHKRAY